ncbi:hypothetical protein JNB63_07745 [Microbacterium trichothecenolyticum]|uniref:hypothetical protein n=1 Tax=Microbacterium trichothecenolyticum TaxID=69370 RepID=UPI001C6F5B6C|nr:hypothetical protein [Microbacterium trichothecenolyticum]MBW9119980.1 hypothetical protein [Microbacterium trichothecenolyticum]
MTSDAHGGGGLELRLRPVAASVPLDRIAFGEVELVAVGDAPGPVSARLNIVEGDLEISVTPAGGTPVRAAWPWPVDSAPRSLVLAPGERLVACVPLLAAGSVPLFPVPGRYELLARFAARPGLTLESNPVALVRTAAHDAALAAGLGDRDVLQSLLGAGVIGAASPKLEQLADSSDAGTAAAANLALGRTDALAEAADDPAVARAVAALLPPGATGPDERRDAVVPRAGARDAAVLSGKPLGEEAQRAVPEPQRWDGRE